MNNSSEALYDGINKLWDREPLKFELRVHIIEEHDSIWLLITKVSENNFYYLMKKNGRDYRDFRVPQELLQRLVDEIYKRYSQNIETILINNLENRRNEILFDVLFDVLEYHADVGVKKHKTSKKRKRSKRRCV